MTSCKGQSSSFVISWVQLCLFQMQQLQHVTNIIRYSKNCLEDSDDDSQFSSQERDEGSNYYGSIPRSSFVNTRSITSSSSSNFSCGDGATEDKKIASSFLLNLQNDLKPIVRDSFHKMYSNLFFSGLSSGDEINCLFAK